MSISLLNQIDEAIESGVIDDMNDQSSGGSGRGLLPAGEAFVRISTYIEYGVQPLPKFKGQVKAPHLTYILGGYIVAGGGTNLAGEDEDYVLEEGKFPYISTFETPLYRNEKARAVRVFNALNHNGKFVTTAQAVGELYIVPITIRKSKRDPSKDVNDIDWSKARRAVDPVTRKPYEAPQLKPEQYKLLLWKKPTIEQWNSIHIEGEWEAKEGKPAQSKNIHQLKCLAANDFEDSALDVLLRENNVEYTIPTLVDDSAGIPDPEDTPEDDLDNGATTNVPDVPSDLN